MQGTREGDRVERNSALELRPRCYVGANSARLSSGDGLRIGIQARHAITALQKLGGEPPIATPNLKNVGTHRNPRCKKHQRFSGRHIDRLDCNKIEHSDLTVSQDRSVYFLSRKIAHISLNFAPGTLYFCPP